MKIVILGGGVIGLSTAYILAKEGFSVSIIEKNMEVGLGASKENGAQLSYSYAAPFADPAILAKLPRFLFDQASPTRIGRWPDLNLLGWIVKFFANCNARDFQKNSRLILKLAYYSKKVFENHFANIENFDYSVPGKLVIYTNNSDLQRARIAFGNGAFALADKIILSSAECYNTEPALVRYPTKIAGGIYSPTDAVGDCQKFCQRMAEAIILLGHDNQVILGAEVAGFRRYGDTVASAITTAGEVEGDIFVLCLGTGAVAIATDLGFGLPVYPLKGYSITAAISDYRVAPTKSITDFSKKIVAANIGGRLRIAGLLDFDGYDTRIRPKRLALLNRQAAELFGRMGDFGSAQGWVGLRPATPSGVPIIGRSPLNNLYLNVGHGGLGLTLAAGSAQFLANQIAKRETELDSRDWHFVPSRWS